MKVLLHIAWAVIVVMCAGACSKQESPNSVKAQTQAMEAAIPVQIVETLLEINCIVS